MYPTILMRHRPQLLHDWFLFSMVGIAILLDRVTKGLIQANFELGQSLPQEGILRLTHITNSGGAFGMFPNQTYLLTLASFGGIGVLLLFYRALPRLGRMVRLSLGLQLGGAIGNLIDRLWAGEVVDFIDIGIWPIFNLADSFIVFGIFLLLGIFLLEERKDSQLVNSNGSISCRRPPAEVGC